MRSLLLRTCAVAALGLAAAPGALAGTTTISTASTSKQTLSSGDTLNITSTGSLTVSGSNVAVTVTGANATLTNLGTLSQTGTGRAVRDNTGVSNLIVTNGSSTNATAVMKTADADVIQMNVAPPAGVTTSVTLNNYGRMISSNASAGGSQVVDFNALTSGAANTVNNYATGSMTASEADAVRPGVNGVVNNWGSIVSTTATGSSSDGVDAQQNNGVSIFNNANASGPTTGGLIEGARHGITGGAADATVNYTMSVTNAAGATIQGDNGAGINIDGFNGLQMVTVVNHGTITGNGHDIGDGKDHDGDGVDVDGLVTLTNTGKIVSKNAFSATPGDVAASEGLSVGGGTITNSGTIQGSVAAGNTNAIGRGITLTGNDLTTGPYAGKRDPIYGDATVTNQAGGKIIGDTDAGIAVVGAYASGHKVTIDNQAGATIQGGGVTAAAIDARASFDDVAIVNAGTIDGSGSGKAIALGAGNNTVTIKGGAVLGGVDGGVGGVNAIAFDLGAGNSFQYTGAVSNFASAEVKSGTANLGGAIGAPVTVGAGAALSPGASGVGALTVGGLTLKAASDLVIDLDPTHGANDVLTVDGAVALDGANLVLDLLSAPTAGESFDIVVNDGTDAVSGAFAEGSWVTASFGGRAYAFRIDTAANADGGLVGNDIRLTAAPEPATWLMMGLGGMLVIGVGARRRAAAAAA